MEMRRFGHSGLEVSALGFGCGAVGGLMVRGTPAEQERTVGPALDAGVNYFDTAVHYGNGLSEDNLGRVLAALKPARAIVATKVRVKPDEMDAIAAAVTASLEASLRRLRRERVDIFTLHNPITTAGTSGALTPARISGEVLPAFERLREAGKARFLGITAVGDTAAVHEVIASRGFDSAQIAYNMLNPSAGAALPADYPGQDYGRLLERAREAGTGAVGIRVLAGGALTGSAERHPVASAPPSPIGSAASYETDFARARRFAPIVAAGGAASLAELATRYALSQPLLGTILVGMATGAEFDAALAAIMKGPLPADVLAEIAAIQRGFAGEPR